MDHPDFSKTPATHAEYKREPYARTLIDGQQVDGKVMAWTRDAVLFHWVTDDDGQHHERWMPASSVTRIRREESAWVDPYDGVG